MNKEMELKIQAGARLAKRRVEVGDHCVMCQEPDAAKLTVGDLKDAKVRHYLEDHHLFGATHEAETVVPLCRNCHALVHMQVPRAWLEWTDNPVERLARAIELIARFLELLAEGLRRLIRGLFPEVCRDHA